MTGERWSRLRELLDRALEEPAGRPALLADIRAEDPTLSRELDALLAEHDAEPEDVEPIAADPAGQLIGPYEIVRELGRGGTGTVFLAVRAEDDVRMPVAVKLLRQSFFDASARSAFRRERQMLVRLDHPNIARLIDWSAASGGLFYLVIEYVEGEPLLDYCSRRRLGLDARLALFADICAAVQHAHQHLVVHRDLKPGNILVSSGGKVKLLDFGIAAALDLATPVHTTLLHRLTPAYASPEQLRGEPATAATDLYSLGAVLYELLAGRLPFRAGDARAVIEEEAAPPSRVAGAAEIPGSQLAGDLDSIVLKALRKDPRERYQSVEQFSADLERYRDGRPVLARHGSRTYVLRRFIGRNRVNLALAALAVCSLITGAAVAAWKWRAAESNLAVAERRYKDMRSFARAMISNVDAGSAASATELQRRISNTAGHYLDQLSRERSADEDLQLEIADAYTELGAAQGAYMNANQGDPAGALANFRKAYDIARAQWKTHHDRAAAEHLVQASSQIEGILPDPAAAADFLRAEEPLASEAISAFPADAAMLTRSAGLFGTGGQRVRNTGDLNGALAMFRRAVELSNRALQVSPDDPGALQTLEIYMAESGTTLRLEGDFTNALKDQEEAHRIALRVLELKPVNKSRRQAVFKEVSMVETLLRLHRDAEAESHARHALAELQAISAGDSANAQALLDLALAWQRLGEVEAQSGKYKEALEAHLEALRIRRGQYRRLSSPQAASAYIASLNSVGTMLIRSHGNLAQAREDLDEAIAVSAKLRAQTPSDVYSLAQLAIAYDGKAEIAGRNSRSRECEETLTQCVEIWRQVTQRSPLDVDLARQANAARQKLAAMQASRVTSR